MNKKINFFLIFSLLLSGCSFGFLRMTSSDKKDYLHARQLYNQGRYEQAIYELSKYVYKATNVKRREARLYLLLGKSYEAINNPKKALEIYTEALDFHPKNIPLLLALANLYQKTSLITQSIESYDEVLTLENTNQEALLGQAINFTLLGFYAKAQYFYQKLFKISPYIMPQWLADYAQTFLQQHDAMHALIYSTQAIEKENSNAQFWFIHAQSYYEMKDIKSALQTLDVAILLDPTNETFLFTKSLWLYDTQNYLESLQVANQLGRANPASYLAPLIQFINLKKLKRDSEARLVLKKVQTQEPDSFIQEIINLLQKKPQALRLFN